MEQPKWFIAPEQEKKVYKLVYQEHWSFQMQYIWLSRLTVYQAILHKYPAEFLSSLLAKSEPIGTVFWSEVKAAGSRSLLELQMALLFHSIKSNDSFSVVKSPRQTLITWWSTGLEIGRLIYLLV